MGSSNAEYAKLNRDYKDDHFAAIPSFPIPTGTDTD